MAYRIRAEHFCFVFLKPLPSTPVSAIRDGGGGVISELPRRQRCDRPKVRPERTRERAQGKHSACAI